MRLDFLPPDVTDDGATHHFCLHCHGEAVEWRTEDGRRYCLCHACGRVADRAVVVDPAINWWTADDGEYWHETAGVFVQDSRGRFLFFDRTAFPFGLTVPAGHVDRGESPEHAAARELAEETGIAAGSLEHLATTPIPGDGCRRGADAHLWHVYRLLSDKGEDVEVTLGPEGTEAVWLTPGEALSRPVTYAVRCLLDDYAGQLAGR